MSRHNRCILIQVINSICIIGGFIGTMVGVSLIPQTISNVGNVYVGSSEQYNSDLRTAQLSSYGLKVTIICLGVFTYGIVSCLFICGYNYINSKRKSTVDPSISPRTSPENIKVIKSILKPSEPTLLKDTKDLELQINIKKWTGSL